MNSRTPDPRSPDADDPQPPEELTRRLRASLRSDAARLPIPRGATAAISRARARRRNRRALVGSAAAVMVLAASSYVITADPGKDELSTAAQHAVIDPALGFDWTVTDNGLAYPQNSSAGPLGLYALSTAPGTKSADFPQGNAPRAMYRLTGDGTWAPVLLEDDDPRLSQVSQRGDTLYALSTGSVTSRDGSPTGSISTDGGESWSSVPLEAATPPSDAVPWLLNYSLDVASTAERTVAVVTASVNVPYEELFPELFTDDPGSLTVTTTDAGVNLVRLPESELEVGADGRPADPNDAEGADRQKKQEQEQATGAESSTTTPEDPTPRSTTPADGDKQGSAGEVVRTVTWAEMGITGPVDLAPHRWAYLADGNNWTEVPVPASATPTLSDSINLEATDDSFVLTFNEMVDATSSRSVSYRSADGQNWTPLSTPGDGQLLTVGDSLVLVGFNEKQTTIQVSSDGANWSPLDLGALDPALADLSPNTWLQASSGPLGIAFVLADEEGNSPRLFFSSDLDRWSVTNLDEVLPDSAYTGDVIVGTDRLVVLGHSSKGEEGSPERSATLTGVPRR